MCQFHQAAIVRRYITKNPIMPDAIELKEILFLWNKKWKSFLNERTINKETGKSFYIHKRLRSAYRSLKTFPGYFPGTIT